MTEWIVSSAVLIVVVALVRQLLKGKISLQLQYALWAIVLVRLLVPVSFGQTKFSVQNALHTQQTVRVEEQGTADLPEAFETPEITIDIPPSRVDYVPPDLSVVEPDPSLPEAEREQQYQQNVQQWQNELDADWEEYKAENTRHVTLGLTDILYIVWFAGMAVTAIVFAVSNLRFGRRLRRSRRELDAVSWLPVYLTGAVETPCLFGLFRPAVYVTPEVAEDEAALAHVLAHEETHCRHWDHVWALLRCVCLVVHWYNPLVWLAASLSRRDAELACDEGAIRRIGEGERSAYGRTLIGLTCAHRSNLLHTATTMTGSKKSIKERIVLIAKKPKMAVYTLIAVILIVAVAVGCTFTGAERIPLVKQLQQVKPETVKLIASQNDTELYWLSEDEYEEMLEMLHGITEEQCLEEVEYPGDFSYGLQVRADEGGWYFRIVTHEEYGEGVIGLYDDYDEDYTKAYWLWIDSPELRQYMIDVFNREKAEISEPPAFVQVAAEVYIEQRRAEVEQKFIAVSMTHEILSELKELSELELGTAGLDWAVKMWQVDYDITVAIGRGQEAGTTAHTAYLVFLYDYIAEEYTRFLGAVDDETLLNVYNTPEMVGKYGDMYRAAAMEIYSQYVEASKQLNTPVSPSDGLYNLTKRGDTVSLTLHTREEGERPTFVLDYQSDAWKTSNRLTGVSWNLLSQAPEGTWDYWLTYTSEDGTVSITFYAGKNGPVCYTDEQRTVWWTERGGTPDAETLRQSVYDPLEAEGWEMTAFAAANAEAAVKLFAYEILAQGQLAPSCGSVYSVLDYEVVSWHVDSVSTDGSAVMGGLTYAVLPEDYESSALWVGNTVEGTGEYDGWLLNSREFVLELQEDGLWHCIGLGTGVYGLESYGYEGREPYSAPGEVPEEEPTDPATALQALANGSDALTMTLFDREWMPTRSLSLAVSATGDYMNFLNLLMDESWVEVELSATPADYRVTLTSPDGTKALTFYSGSQGLVEYTCGDVSVMWMSANGAWDGDSQYAAKIREIYQFWEYFPNQIFVRAANPEAAAAAYVAAHEDMYRNMSPGNYHSVTDYETLEWGIDEVSADGTMVQGWLRYALVPAMGVNYFMEGGAELGTGEYEGWVINGMGFRLVLQPEGHWACTSWGGGMITMEYYGYEVREPYSVPWEVPEQEPTPTYEEYFSQLVDYGYDWFANTDSDIELKVSSGSNLGGYVLEYEEPYLYVSKHELYGGERQWTVTAMEDLKVMYCGPDWFYALVGGKTLIRMDYWGINYEVLFHDETGLIDQNGEYSFKLADGKVMYFLAGTEDGGAAIYRLYLPEKRVDAVYEYTAAEVEALTFAIYGDGGIEPVECQIYAAYPVSNHEVTWTVYNPAFWELYAQLLEDPEAYEKYFAPFPGESISSVLVIAREYKIYPYTEHYHNTLTGEHDTVERIGYSEGAPTRWWLE